ncbi:hypothetical protein ACU5P1_08095 [Pseudomonas plecoglossicida]|uniref:DUF3094 domain-containing protein n=1 Tax=Pseudomonas plecoglossicida TaxID=70775 RepID=A0AAD0R1U9_PSEDL|nr:hypothetical protein [Pseudomonas plecoglossicida]AXM98642.1 hypothetical protein DVB73_24025 [Pseudomonas plecoglossicida]QLB54788.1 hypothetical protein HAV28_08035 [Pseudomonas plecoglossicida]GLR34670.1 hypothetical protein GCM10011247_00670 [Pseudomonas plecoglossicida]
MQRITPESAEQFQRDLKELDEEIRNATRFSPWQFLLLLSLGAGITLVAITAFVLLLRQP